MKKHRNNLMKRGLAAVLSGMMLLATVMPAMAAGSTPAPVAETVAPAAEPAAAPAPAPTPTEGASTTSELVSAGTPVTEEIGNSSASNGSVSNGDPEAPEVPQENGEGTPEPVSNGSQPEAVSGSTEGSTNSSEGSTDGSAPVPAGAEGTAPQSTVELLPVDETAPEGTSHTLIEINEETTTKELSTEPMTLEAHTYNGINVKVEADAGVLPVDTHLSVFEVKSETHRTETAEKLDEAEVDYDDYMVLDISLYDSEFNKIEPESGVRVSITMDAEKLPEDAASETLGVQHLEEDENGEVKDVVQVADNGLETEGLVEVTDSNEVAADFEVGSFSKFVITWKKHAKFLITFEARLKGTEELIENFRWPDTETEANTVSLTDLNGGDVDAEGTEFILEDLLRKFSMYRWDEYQFESAKLGQVTQIEKFKIDFKEELVDGTPTLVKRFQQYGVKNGKPDQWGDGFKTDGTENPTITLYYEKVEPGLHAVPTLDSTSMGVKMHMFRFDATGTPTEITDDKPEEGWKEAGIAGRLGKNLYYKDSWEAVISPYQYGDYRNNSYNTTGNMIDKEIAKAINDSAYDDHIKMRRGTIWQNLTSLTVQEDGYPLIDMSGKRGNGSFMDYATGAVRNTPLVAGENALSLKEWFDPEGNGLHQMKTADGYVQQVNHLFREDIYNAYGYFYYSSDRNGAVLDGTGETADFIVYNETATPTQTQAEDNKVSAFWAQRGNFLPYNRIDVTKNFHLNTKTDMAGNKLVEGDKHNLLFPGEDLYGKEVYPVIPLDPSDPSYQKTNQSPGGSNNGGVQKGIVYYYGMSMEADFFQPADGLVTNPTTGKDQPMIFEFNGDDDFWVYIDGVLVLDLGGVHDAQSGVINFKTGDIYWTDNGSYRVKKNNNKKEVFASSGEVRPNQSVSSTKYTDMMGNEDATLYYDAKTTIRQAFVDALGSTAVNSMKNFWDGNTFREGTGHNIKIYYMEHGGGAANLRLTFNLQLEPKGNLRLDKEFTEDELTFEVLENGEEKVGLPEGFEADFKVYTAYKPEDGSSNGLYLPDELVKTVKLNQEAVDNGEWTLIPTDDGHFRFVHTLEDLSLRYYYIVDEVIYTPGTGYVGTELYLKDTKNVAGPSDKMAPEGVARGSLMTAGTAAGMKGTATAGTKGGATSYDNTIATMNWGNGGSYAQFLVKAYTTDGTPITNVPFVNPTDVVVNFDGMLPAGQAGAQKGNNLLFENILKSQKASGSLGSLMEIKDANGSFPEYVFDHFEWGPEANKNAVGVQITDNGFYLLERDNGLVPAIQGSEYLKGRNQYEIKAVYKRMRFRTDAFELFPSDDTNHPAKVLVENKYLTPLKIRKKLTSHMETDLNRDFSFRIYVNGEVKDYLKQGVVHELKKDTWEYTGEKATKPVMGPMTDAKGTYYQFTIRRDQEMEFLLPKNRGIQYSFVEIIEPGYKVTADIDGETRPKDERNGLALTKDEGTYSEGDVLKTGWVSADQTFNEWTTVTYKNNFEIVRTGLSMSTVPFILMVVFALLAIGGLAFITIRRRAMNIDD